MQQYNSLFVIGPTAVGKTALACVLAQKLNGEIISADSRQVFRGMDIGTGKDMKEYHLNGIQIPYHLIDIREAGEEYSAFDFQNDFITAFEDILKRKKLPIVCGGTGFYLEAALAKEKMLSVPENPELRKRLSPLSHNELQAELSMLKLLHNTTDTNDRERLIRAIEIEQYKMQYQPELMPEIKPLIICLYLDRNQLKERINARLKERLENGMIKEVESLLKQGVSHDRLQYYGLEYKYVSLYLKGKLNYNDMHQKLRSAIHQFAKRQMTWFRRMEKQGHQLVWVDAGLPLNEKVRMVVNP